MLLTLQKLTFFSPKLQTLILSCLKSFGFYKLLEMFLPGCLENCYYSWGKNRLFLPFLSACSLAWFWIGLTSVQSLCIVCLSRSGPQVQCPAPLLVINFQPVPLASSSSLPLQHISSPPPPPCFHSLLFSTHPPLLLWPCMFFSFPTAMEPSGSTF